MDATATITRARRPRSYGIKAVAVVLGGLLLALALPRLGLELDLLRADQLTEAADRDALADLGLMHRTATTLEAGGDTATLSRAHVAAARLRLAAARRQGLASPEGSADLQAALQDQIMALARAPGDADGWGRVAYARYALRRLPEAVQAWRLSYVMGPYDPPQMPQRTAAGIALWRYMDLPARDAMRLLLLQHRAWDASGLAEMIHRYGAEALVRQSLARDPEALRDIESRLSRL